MRLPLHKHTEAATPFRLQAADRTFQLDQRVGRLEVGELVDRLGSEPIDRRLQLSHSDPHPPENSECYSRTPVRYTMTETPDKNK